MTASPSADALPARAAATPLPIPEALDAPEAAAPDATDAQEAADAAAWAEVVAGWDDEARHRAYLARFHDLEGLATAGRRYRAVLTERPGDAIAARQRDEVVRRATALGLASLPRTEPGNPRARAWVRAAGIAVAAGLLVVAALMAVRLLPFVASWGAQP